MVADLGGLVYHPPILDFGFWILATRDGGVGIRRFRRLMTAAY
jgi:hypothetical protein